jgi:hypothetical protein
MLVLPDGQIKEVMSAELPPGTVPEPHFTAQPSTPTAQMARAWTSWMLNVSLWTAQNHRLLAFE